MISKISVIHVLITILIAIDKEYNLVLC
jgi:hypothetical protein